jgi:hypothetical protein
VVIAGSDPPVVSVEEVGADAGAVVVEDPCFSIIAISCPVVPPVIELEVTFPDSTISKPL